MTRIRVQLTLTRTLHEGAEPEVRHEIDEVLVVESVGPGYVINQQAPKCCGPHGPVVVGRGMSEAEAVLCWLTALMGRTNMAYRPKYFDHDCPMCHKSNAKDFVCPDCGYRKDAKCGQSIDGVLYTCDDEHESSGCKSPARPCSSFQPWSEHKKA